MSSAMHGARSATTTPAGSTAATFPGLFDISRTDVSPKYRRMRDTGNFHVPGEQGDKIRGCNGSAPPAKQKSS
jgi:hypothetical protein